MFGLVADEGRRGGLPVIAAIFWSGLVGLFCVVVGKGAMRQVASAERPTVQGVITVSEPSGKKGDSWNLQYEYSVAGQPYSATAYAHDPMPVQGEEEVRRHVAAYPVGAVVDVYYD